jgi:Mlc titration factor MtfA (ptsG expression regulator)
MESSKNIKNKPTISILIVTKAEKDILVILTPDQYKQKIQNYIQQKQFIKIKTIQVNNTKKLTKTTSCSNIIAKENKWKCANMNKAASNLRATTELHEHNTPIGPTAN